MSRSDFGTSHQAEATTKVGPSIFFHGYIRGQCFKNVASLMFYQTSRTLNLCHSLLRVLAKISMTLLVSVSCLYHLTGINLASDIMDQILEVFLAFSFQYIEGVARRHVHEKICKCSHPIVAKWRLTYSCGVSWIITRWTSHGEEDENVSNAEGSRSEDSKEEGMEHQAAPIHDEEF